MPSHYSHTPMRYCTECDADTNHRRCPHCGEETMELYSLVDEPLEDTNPGSDDDEEGEMVSEPVEEDVAEVD